MKRTNAETNMARSPRRYQIGLSLLSSTHTRDQCHLGQSIFQSSNSLSSQYATLCSIWCNLHRSGINSDPPRSSDIFRYVPSPAGHALVHGNDRSVRRFHFASIRLSLDPRCNRPRVQLSSVECRPLKDNI